VAGGAWLHKNTRQRAKLTPAARVLVTTQVEGGDWNGGSFVLANGERTSPADPMRVDGTQISSKVRLAIST
jgi:hypothetical protein